MKEEEAEAARKAEQENKKKSMLKKIGNFFSGKVNELKEEERRSLIGTRVARSQDS